MKYNFEFSGVSFNSGQKDLVIILEKEVELVATFLMSDVQGDPDYAIEKIENVLNGKSEHEELNGNICGLEISMII